MKTNIVSNNLYSFQKNLYKSAQHHQVINKIYPEYDPKIPNAETCLERLQSQAMWQSSSSQALLSAMESRQLRYDVLCGLSTIAQAPVVVLLESGSNIVAIPFHIIEQLACSIINFLGALFSKNYTIKHGLLSAESALCSIATMPVKLALEPFKAAYQFCHIMRNPDKAAPYRCYFYQK